MDWLAAARALAKAVLLPPTGPLLLAIAGLLLVRRAPRAGRAIAWAGIGSLWLLSLPLVASWLLLPFDRPALDIADARGAQAIVILGGGTRKDAPEYGGDTLSPLTLERVRYGAHVARLSALPVLVSGGVPPGGSASEAAVMSHALHHEYGVSVRWREDRSRNTRENAQLSAALLRRDGVERVVLVAHAFDIPRASAEFAEAGIATVPAATGLASRAGGLALGDVLPSPAALQRSWWALYEMLGIAWQRASAWLPVATPEGAGPRPA